MAGFARHQAATVADNINSLAQGRSDLVEYQSMGVAIAVTIGPTGGAGQFPAQDQIVGRETITQVKGRDLMVDQFGELRTRHIDGTLTEHRSFGQSARKGINRKRGHSNGYPGH